MAARRPCADTSDRTRSWASFRAGKFGTGYLVCQGEAVERVWLPGPEARSAFNLYRLAIELPARPGGYAQSLAPRFVMAFTDGEDLTDLPIVLPPACPAFLRRLYEACKAIPAGETVSYRRLAEMAGNAAAARAAGNAMSRNPLPLVVPCHRVVPTAGGVGNYGGGSAMKQRLLQAEGALESA